MIDHESERFGSARLASEAEIRRAGLFRKRGVPIGYWGQKPLSLDGDAPLITFAGAGSGKLRDLLGYVMCSAGKQRMLVVDPRGELAAISLHNHVRYRSKAWCWNPAGLHPGILPQHRCNPLSVLQIFNPRFHADCKFIVEGLVPLSSGDGQFWELRARQWIEVLLKARVEQHGGTSFPDLLRTINVIEGDRDAWIAQLTFMVASQFDDVRRTAGEMLSMQQESPKTFASVMGHVYAATGFLDDPMLLRSLDAPDFSLAALCDPDQAGTIFINVPIEYVSIWAPILRAIFTAAMLYKSRSPASPRVTMIVDEAGQMGRFEALLRAFTFGRGAGIRAWALFQDVGQVVRNYGAPALQGFMGSAQMRQFFGVRDFETASMISKMLGTETLSYDTLAQEEARRQKIIAARRMFDGEDPFDAARDYAHYAHASGSRTKQARSLMTPDEILAWPEDRQLLFISGLDLPPVFANKYPYFTRREMAGSYLNNPYHPPGDRVRIRRWFGSRWADIITEPVPPELRGFPQHETATGVWRYVRGYRPI